MTTTPLDHMPPHSVEAEEALLGSLLIDTEAIYRVSGFLKHDDFYIVKNQWVWDACMALHERREPIDAVTLRREMEARGQLDELGGPAYITYLMTVVPTAIHAEGYGHIVERAALRRRLLNAASEIAQLAYDESDEIDQTIDRAEQTLFGVSQRRVARDMQPIAEVIRQYYDRIEYLYEHRGEPLGIPTGFIDLDKMLGGLQRSDLIIIAARPGVGKTSLMLNVALSAARRFHQRVAVFSLEMSNEQIIQRLVSAETGIDSQRLRTGDLHEDEWPLFVQATSALSDALVFVDDTPSISALQLRTKARRLHSEHGLDLIIIDYLQLMSGDSRTENRVQEISYLSRSLKGLARELNVPVLVASQLSRAVEQRSDKRPVLSDLRESGCLTGDTLITLADTGRPVPMRNLVGQAGFGVWALNEQTLKIERAEVSRAFSTGRKPVYRMVTRLGRVIRATGNHKFRMLTGWQRLDELAMGDRIALPRQIASSQAHSMTYAEAAWDATSSHANLNSDFALESAVAGLTLEAERQLHRSGGSWRSLASNRAIDSLMPLWTSHEHKQQRLSTVGSDERPTALASSDVYWDAIISIEPDGEEEVFDLTVPGLSNFVANDIIVHNSIEQDADIVMFIYRDDVYDAESERKNVAELIIAKHRNGPTGTVELYFQRNLTQFKNAMKRDIAL